MNVSTIITNVQTLIGDDQFKATDLVTYANWYQNEVLGNYRVGFMEKSGTISILSGATTGTLPTDMQTSIAMYLTVPQVFNMDAYYMPYESFMREFANFANNTPMNLRQWTVFGRNIRLSAPTDTAHTINIDYLKRPTQITLTTDPLEIPDVYEEMVTLGTLIRALEQNEDYSEASQRRTILAPLETAFVRNEARGGAFKTGPIIMRNNTRLRGGE